MIEPEPSVRAVRAITAELSHLSSAEVPTSDVSCFQCTLYKHWPLSEAPVGNTSHTNLLLMGLAHEPPRDKYSLCEDISSQAGKMAQHIKAHAAKPDDLFDF